MNNDWIPVSGSPDLAASAARAVVLPAHDIAIWRTASGSVQAWENRCPHRGMRMSFGQVRDDRLVCRYHGWSFDDGGQCRAIPASPDMAAPPTACIKTHGCKEGGGLIWVNVTDNPDAEVATPDGQAADDGSALFCKSIFVDGNLESLMPLVKTAQFPLFGDQEGNNNRDWTGVDVSPGVIRISASDAPGEDVTIAGHQAVDGRCGLHVVVPSKADEAVDGLRRLHYAAWAVKLRWYLSAPQVKANGFPVFAE